MDNEIKNTNTVVTIAGSMKFWDDMVETAARLTKVGYIVLSPYRINLDPSDNEDEIRSKVSESFKRKIEMSDILFVIDKDGYIGKDVYGEIQYAMKLNKRIEFLEVRDIAPIFTICGSRRFKEHIEQYADNLRRIGKIVFTPETFNIGDMSILPADQINRWHNIHYQKMQMADYVIIFDEDGYIGDDTKRELEYALFRGMKVLYYSNLKNFNDIDKFN